jgi:hypothetical protein
VSLPAHAISIKAGYTELLENWFQSEILTLYERHAELAHQSLNRKIGALRLGVEAALRARIRRSDRGQAETAKLRDLERELRRAAGTIAETRTVCTGLTDALRDGSGDWIRRAAVALVAATDPGPGKCGAVLKAKLEEAAADYSARIALLAGEAARKAARALAKAAKVLDIENRPEEDELLEVVKDMPRFDAGELGIDIRPGVGAAILGRRWATGSVERRIRKTAGRQIAGAVSGYERVLQAWVRRTFTELQARFDSYADAYRAQLARLTANPAPGAEEQALLENLAALAGAGTGEPAREDAPGAVA